MGRGSPQPASRLEQPHEEPGQENNPILPTNPREESSLAQSTQQAKGTALDKTHSQFTVLFTASHTSQKNLFCSRFILEPHSFTPKVANPETRAWSVSEKHCTRGRGHQDTPRAF